MCEFFKNPSLGIHSLPWTPILSFLTAELSTEPGRQGLGERGGLRTNINNDFLDLALTWGYKSNRIPEDY